MTVFIVGVALIVVAYCIARAHLTGDSDRCPHCSKDHR